MIKDIPNTETLISKIIGGIDDVKGVKVNILDLREIQNTVCSYFIICNGTSNTHVNAIVNSVQKNVSKNLKEKPYHTEGQENSEWVLIDYIDVVVHVFQKQIRDRYNLENLWGDARSIQIASNY
jgi:ribosome-associated protein|tara:strand:+ start:12579 stop:12950 length:372 start_codon:yes stop_codon:yes gene_type:complete